MVAWPHAAPPRSSTSTRVFSAVPVWTLSVPTISRIIYACATDWIAPPVRSPVAELLADLSRGFAAAGIRWYLFGAQAAIVYGVARLTADVDVTARVPAGMATATWLPVVDRLCEHPLPARSRRTDSRARLGGTSNESYGMGLSQRTCRGVQTVAHGGALAGYRTNFVRVAGEKLAVVTLCNNATANAARPTEMVVELYAPAGLWAAAAEPSRSATPGLRRTLLFRSTWVTP
jgi:hypothetical protein